MNGAPPDGPTPDPTDHQLTDDDLLAMLGAALDASDPVPERVLEGARAAFTWRNIDIELAQIVFDSAHDLAGVRSEEINRQLTFQAPGVEIEVMMIENGQRRLVGQLIPPLETSVELVAGDEVQAAQSDRLGRFSFDDLGPGPVRLVVLGGDGQRLVQTDWVLF
jgi:hypothetical protein